MDAKLQAGLMADISHLVQEIALIEDKIPLSAVQVPEALLRQRRELLDTVHSKAKQARFFGVNQSNLAQCFLKYLSPDFIEVAGHRRGEVSIQPFDKWLYGLGANFTIISEATYRDAVSVILMEGDLAQ